MKRIWITCLFGLVSAAAMAQYTGRVFIDSNSNNVYDKGEKGMKGVSVSDGLNVVQTNTEGTYSLPGQPKERFIFITTPSGYKTDNAYYKRIEKGVATYDFALRHYQGGIKPNGAHQFIHISDTEIGESEGHDDWIGNLRDYAANEGVAFIVHTGDICYRPGLENHIKIMNTANMPGTQVFYTVGNHDLVSGKYGEAYFEELYGPPFYSFEVGNVHYIVTPMPGGDYSPSYRTEDVCKWLKNDLKQVPKDMATMMFNHSTSNDTGSFRFGSGDTEYIDLTEHNLKAWLYGHWHVNHIHRHAVNGVSSICTSTPVRGGIDHAPSAFRVLKVDQKGDFTSEFRYCYIDKSVQIASVVNEQAPVLASGAVPLSVNAYSSTTPVRTVSYSYRTEGKGATPQRPLKQQTDFNWYAEIPLSEHLDNRLVTVMVEASFANGEVAKTERSFIYKKQARNAIRPGDEWPNLLGSPQHVSLVRDSLATPLCLSWVKNVGANIWMTSPIISRGTVFVASTDDNESGKASVIGMDAQTGDIRWKYPVRGSVRNSIATTDGLVFAQDVHGMLYAIDAEKGRLVWEKELGISMVPALNDGLIAANGIVYAGTGKSLCALKATTGEVIWQNSDWNRGEGCTATLSLNKNILIGHANWGALYANDATTGRKLWGASDHGLRHRSASAAMHGDVLYLISDQSFFVIESKTGNVLVRKELGYNVNVTSTPLVTDTEIVFGTSARGIVALDRETLAEKWNFLSQPAMFYSAPYVRNPASTVETSPVLAGNTIFVGASDGILYALDRKNGKLQWKHRTGAPFLATVAISGNALYAADFSGNVYGFVSE